MTGAAALLVAVVAQVTIVNSLPLPGGSPPDLVLITVVTFALLSGPMEGALAGFCGGLAADIAPPAAHLLGQSALVFCLVGYGCGLLRGALERSDWLPLTGVVMGVAAGETLYALVGIIFGDPGITWHSARQVLPAAVTYDILLSPFALYALARLGGYRAQRAGALGPGLGGHDLASAGAAALAGVAAAGGAVRDTGSGRGPRLRAGGARQVGAWSGGEREPGTRVHRPGAPRLRLRGGVAGSAAAAPAGPPRLLAAVHPRFGRARRRDGLIGGAPGSAARTAIGGRPGSLRAAAFSGGPSALTAGGQARGPRPARLRLGSRHRGDGLVGGGALGRGSSWGPAARRGRAPGRGAFRGSSLGSGMGAGGPARGRFLPRRRRPGGGPGSGVAPRFRGRGRLRRLLPRRGGR